MALREDADDRDGGSASTNPNKMVTTKQFPKRMISRGEGDVKYGKWPSWKLLPLNLPFYKLVLFTDQLQWINSGDHCTQVFPLILLHR